MLTRSVGILLVTLALNGPAPAYSQSAFASPSLTFRAAIDLAIAQNLELAAVRRARAIRQADVRTAGQWANPEMSAEVGRDVPHGDVTVGLPIDIFGTRSRRIAMAKEALTMADIDEAAALKALRRNVRLAFYGLLAAGEATVLAQDLLNLAERVKDVAQARFEEGAAPRLDVMQAELEVARVRADLERTRAERRAVQADLNALLNRPPGMTIELAGDASDIPPVPTLDRATAAAMTSSVDLLTADREAAIENRRLSLLQAERVPSPVFSVGTALNAPGEFTVGPHAGISVSIPLFSRNQGEIAASIATIDTIKARREAMHRQVEARVFAALERVVAQRAHVETYRVTLVPTAVSLQGMAEESYRLGRNSILAALDAQRSLRDVKFEYVQALVGLQSAVADLEDILGGPIQ